MLEWKDIHCVATLLLSIAVAVIFAVNFHEASQREFVGPPDPAVKTVPRDGLVDKIYFRGDTCVLVPPRKVRKGEQLNLRAIWNAVCEPTTGE